MHNNHNPSLAYNTNLNLYQNNLKENLNNLNNNTASKNHFSAACHNNNITITNNVNMNVAAAAAKSNPTKNDNNTSHTANINNNNNLVNNLDETSKKINLHNSKIIKNNLIYNLYNAKAELNTKAKVENKYENKKGKVDRIEKPESSKYTKDKDKKDASNYNKIVIFSNNYNPKILKERVFLTKQPTNKNSRKTSSEKNAEKRIAFYTNGLQMQSNHLKPLNGKSTVSSSGKIDKNTVINLNGLTHKYNNNFINCNLASQKQSNFGVNSLIDPNNYLISTQNLQKIQSSVQSSIEKAKISDLYKRKNIGNPKVDYSLVNTEENAYEISTFLVFLNTHIFHIEEM